VEAYARCSDAATRYPVPVVVAHENAAVGMAHGFYMATRRPQAVMLHVSVGAANAVCGLMNAARAQVPIFFTAGRTPLFESGELGSRDAYIHWAQEMFDQGAMLREVVKWDYELRDGRNLADVVDRGMSVAMTHPRGPVYLTLPREVLARPVTAAAVPPVPALPAAPRGDQAAVRLLAERICAADFPAVSCGMTGIDEGCQGLLVELAERFGVAINENKPRYANFPPEHALHAGFDIDAVAGQADCLLFLDCDVPWMPGGARPRETCFIAHAGTDPLYGSYPMRSFRSDLTVTSDSAALLEDLIAALDAIGAGKAAAARKDRIATHCAGLRESARGRGRAAGGRAGPRTKILQ
jgi:acetolactate synthase-1/2/3 large subunit